MEDLYSNIYPFECWAKSEIRIHKSLKYRNGDSFVIEHAT